jgi:DNA modification methylase
MRTNVVYQGDCIQGLKKFPDNSVDFILSDYPFNCQDGRKDYNKFIGETAQEFYRILKPNCVLLIINNPPNIFKTIYSYKKFVYRDGIALIRKGALRPAWHFGFQHNYCLTLLKPEGNTANPKLKWNGCKKNHDKSFMTDVIQYQNGYRGKGKDWHPQAIPKDLVEKFIEIFTDENDVVLDPFMGSGTTAIVCQALNRRYIGFEINPKYCKIIQKRLSQKTITEFFHTQANESQIL